MSFTLWTVACAGILKTTNPARTGGPNGAGCARQSTDGPVLGLRSRRALSPVPRAQCNKTAGRCHDRA
jgi:hypothetical protein